MYYSNGYNFLLWKLWKRDKHIGQTLTPYLSVGGQKQVNNLFLFCVTGKYSHTWQHLLSA